MERRCARSNRESDGGKSVTRPDSIRWPGVVAAVCLLALAALEIAIMMEVGR